MCFTLSILTQNVSPSARRIRRVSLYQHIWIPTFEHMNAGFWGISHGIHEDAWKELGQDDSDFGSHQFVRQHLGHQLRSLLSDVWVGGVSKQVQEVNRGTFGQSLFHNLSIGHQRK